MTTETLLPGRDAVSSVVDDPSTAESETSAELRRTFWMLVVIVDVALLAVALGALLVLVEGRAVVGGAVLAVGLLGFAESYRRIRARRNT